MLARVAAYASRRAAAASLASPVQPHLGTGALARAALSPLSATRPPSRSLCWARTDNPDLDPEVPDPGRVLVAAHRGPEESGQYRCRLMRKAGRTPINLVGDRLPYVSLSVDTKELMTFVRRTHCQRELLTLRVPGGVSDFEGEDCLVLPQIIDLKDRQTFGVNSVTFRRWPRDPERNPVKVSVPLIFMHQDAVPAVKAGSYVHEMFETGQGLRCWVRQREHIPRFLLCDMRRSKDGDLRYEALDMPPGVTPRKYKAGRTDGNFLVARVIRVRG